MADEIESKMIGVDVDNRDETVGKKIRDAEKEIPYIIVLGEKEAGAEKFPVRVRADGKLHEMAVKDLIAEIEDKTGGELFKPLPTPLCPRNGLSRVG